MTDLQSKILDLLKEIDKICRENDIYYYLVGGTLIGALRHKGFIPWDDDADIIMTRDNWEKFWKCTKNTLADGMAVNSQYDDPGLACTVNHYTDTKTATMNRYHITNPEKSGIMIDVIIMDPVPDTEEAKREYVEALTEYSELTLIPYQYSIRIGKKTHFDRYWKKQKAVGMRKTLDEIVKTAFSHSEEESQLYAQRLVVSPHFWPKEQFGKPRYVPFEDTMLPVPERAEDCLCIGFDDDWMYVPGGGVTKSQHTFSVRSLSIPGELISNDFESRIDRKKLMKTYIKRKKIQIAQTENKFRSTMDSYLLVAEKVRLSYKKKLKNVNIEELLADRDYDAIEELFDEYIHIQCSNHFLGSSAMEGWINWYRKKHPYLIDIGDDALYAVLDLLMYRGKLARVSKLLKARLAIDRPLTEKLNEMQTRYTAIKNVNSAFDRGEFAESRKLLDEYFPRYPENIFLWRAELKLKEHEGASPREIIALCDKALCIYPEDAVCGFYLADAVYRLGDIDSALEMFGFLVSYTNHGIVLLKMKERMEELIKSAPTERAYHELWLSIRHEMGEEELPDINDLFPIEEETESEEGSTGLQKMKEYAEELINEFPGERTYYELWLEIRRQMGEEDLPTIDELLPNPENADSEGGSETEGAEEPSGDDDDNSGQSSDEDKRPEQIVEETEAEEPGLTDIQEKRFELLCEFKEICAQNGIRYYLIGKGLLQAAREKKYFDPDGELAVAMTPFNVQKFLEVTKNLEREDRFVDSMATNPEFHRFCVRYGNTETLDMFTSQCGNPNSGIFITIEILRNPAKSKLRNQVDQMLEAGWETRNTMKWSSAKRWISYLSVMFLCLIMGKKRAGKYLFDRFCKGPKKKAAGRYYLKPFWGDRTFYDSYWFKFSRNVRLNDVAFSTMKPYEKYLESVFGAKWKKRNYPYTNANEFSRVTDASISCQTYYDHLRQNGIDLNEMWRHKQKTNRKYAPVVTMGAETTRYWDIMCQCGERWRLLEKYGSQKLYILELFRENRIKPLLELFKDYLDTAEAFRKKGLGMCFDRRIFEIMEYCLKVTGKARQAAALRKVMQPQDWEPIYLPGMEVNGMREATANDIPAILMYLKRNVANCLYMYIDIAKYGLDNPNMKVWVDSNNNGITLVVMKYHQSISAFTNAAEWDVEGVAKLIEDEKVLSVTVPKAMSEKLYPLCENNYSETLGSVFEFTNFRDLEFDGEIEVPTNDDAIEIATLIAADDSIGTYYEIQNLADQLIERWETNMGRSFIIRVDGKIVAHVGSYAEFDGLASTNGLIVHPDHRSSVYGAVLERHLLYDLLKDGFKVYTFITKRLRYKLMVAMGNEVVGEYARYVREENKGE